jgi:hypothetical protein
MMRVISGDIGVMYNTRVYEDLIYLLNFFAKMPHTIET